MKGRVKSAVWPAAVLAVMALSAAGCGKTSEDARTQVRMVQYKPEAVKVFEELENEFNRTHEDIKLTIESPNDAMTVLKTMFVKEEIPDIVGIGGDIIYSNFLDADMFMDISDYEGLSEVKEVYLEIDKNLEFVPLKGTYAVPYAGNAAGVLYNRTMFQENGWTIPTTWQEFLDLCERIKDQGQQPLYFGFKDTWTCLAPWNAMCADLAPADICARVNRGETVFKDAYRETAEKILKLIPYAQKDPYGYSYNDACTAFARGESAMYVIGSYAVPQIKSVNPDMDIDSFVFPAADEAEQNLLNSGIDLQFSVMKACENKEAAYEVLRFLQEDQNVQKYMDAQNAVPCKEGDFELPSMLDGMLPYIREGKMADYQDHYYPAEMTVDAMIQTYLMEGDPDAFLGKFDADWKRYNRDIIRKVKEFERDGEKEGGR